MQCPVCGGAVSQKVHRRVRDFEHGLAVLADFDGCPSCGLIAQVPPPDAAALATYYPSDYRPHAAAVSVILFGNVAQANPLGAIALDVLPSARTSESEMVPTTTNDLVVRVIADALIVRGTTLGNGETPRSVAKASTAPSAATR